MGVSKERAIAYMLSRAKNYSLMRFDVLTTCVHTKLINT